MTRFPAPAVAHVLPAAKPQVYVVEDDPDLRDVLSMLLAGAGLSSQVYANGSKFLESYDPRSPGCVLLDVNLPDMTGLDVQQHLAAQGHNPAIVFLTGNGNVPGALQAMRDGAVDYIEKPFRAPQLLARIEAAIAFDGQSRRLRAKWRELEDRKAVLSGRERQVMSLMALGHSTKEIAARLEISPKTVDKHRAKVLEKMQVDNAIELTHLLLTQKAPSPLAPDLGTTRAPAQAAWTGPLQPEARVS